MQTLNDLQPSYLLVILNHNDCLINNCDSLCYDIDHFPFYISEISGSTLAAPTEPGEASDEPSRRLALLANGGCLLLSRVWDVRAALGARASS